MPLHIAVVAATAPTHIHPHLALVRELVRRGHRVSYTVGEHLTHMAEPTGAHVIAHPTTLPDTTSSDAPGAPSWPDDPVSGMRMFLDEGIATLPYVVAAFDGDEPDVVLHDIGGHAGPVAAVRWGVPAIQLSPSMVAWEGWEEDNAEFVSLIHESPAGVAFYARFAAWLAEHGVRRSPDEVMGRPERGLALIARALQPKQELVSERFQFVGPLLEEERIGAGGWAPPAGAGRVLYLAFGSAYNDQVAVYRACIEAFGGGDWHVVMAIGPRTDRAALRTIPPNVEVHESVAQLAVLEHADAFVTHAGMGSTQEALWFAVPTVAIPQAVDQFANAAQIEALGIGRQLPAEEVTAATLRAAVEHVASDRAIAERLAELSSQVRASGGAARAADAVERLAAAG